MCNKIGNFISFSLLFNIPAIDITEAKYMYINEVTSYRLFEQ